MPGRTCAPAGETDEQLARRLQAEYDAQPAASPARPAAAAPAQQASPAGPLESGAAVCPIFPACFFFFFFFFFFLSARRRACAGPVTSVPKPRSGRCCAAHQVWGLPGDVCVAQPPSELGPAGPCKRCSATCSESAPSHRRPPLRRLRARTPRPRSRAAGRAVRRCTTRRSTTRAPARRCGRPRPWPPRTARATCPSRRAAPRWPARRRGRPAARPARARTRGPARGRRGRPCRRPARCAPRSPQACLGCIKPLGRLA